MIAAPESGSAEGTGLLVLDLPAPSEAAEDDGNGSYDSYSCCRPRILQQLRGCYHSGMTAPKEAVFSPGAAKKQPQESPEWRAEGIIADPHLAVLVGGIAPALRSKGIPARCDQVGHEGNGDTSSSASPIGLWLTNWQVTLWTPGRTSGGEPEVHRQPNLFWDGFSAGALSAMGLTAFLWDYHVPDFRLPYWSQPLFSPSYFSCCLSFCHPLSSIWNVKALFLLGVKSQLAPYPLSWFLAAGSGCAPCWSERPARRTHSLPMQPFKTFCLRFTLEMPAVRERGLFQIEVWTSPTGLP